MINMIFGHIILFSKHGEAKQKCKQVIYVVCLGPWQMATNGDNDESKPKAKDWDDYKSVF